MDLKKLIGDPSAAIPEDLLPIMHELASGELVSIVMLAERRDGQLMSMWQVNLNEGTSHLIPLLGGLELVKHELLLAADDDEDDE